MTEANTDALMAILPGLLAPLLANGPDANRNLAHHAARQAIVEYRASTHAELINITQIIGFALAALDDLSLSMAADLSVSAKLKLRGNANALNRASLRAADALDRNRQPKHPDLHEWADQPEPSSAEPPASGLPMAEPPALQPVSATRPVDEQNRWHWANAMTTVAAELQSRAILVPHAQRKSDRLWVDVLTDVVGELRQSGAAPKYPGLSKADLLRTTLMAGGGFPGHLIAKPRPRAPISKPSL